jgi:hypothetical protein
MADAGVMKQLPHAPGFTAAKRTNLVKYPFHEVRLEDEVKEELS